MKNEVIPVGDIESLRHLVKEFELLRRRRGREFFVAMGGADHVREVTVNERNEILIREEGRYQPVSESDLPSTKLGQALRAGTLYTRDVYAPRLPH